MRLFGKIFTAVLLSFIIVGSLAVYVASVKQISYACKNILEQNRIISRFLAKEIEVGYAQSQWPFENLAEVSRRKDFLFWWVVRDDGVIHLADKASFMGTVAYSYFPQLSDMKEEENAILDHKQNYGIFVKALDIGKKRWLFLLGFSLQDLLDMKKSVIISSVLSFILILLILGVLLYSVVKYLTRPIRDLVRGAEIIGRGDLTYRVKIETWDELGELASSFNKMTEDLQKTTVSRDELVKEAWERKKTEEELKRQKDFIRKALDSFGTPFYVVNLDHTIALANMAAKEKGILEGGYCYQVTHRRQNPCDDKDPCPLREVLRTGKAAKMEHIHYDKEGNKTVVELHGYPLFDKDGQIVQMIELTSDITERRMMEEELKKKVEDLERFNKLAVDRELKMIELKKRIAELEAKAG